MKRIVEKAPPITVLPSPDDLPDYVPSGHHPTTSTGTRYTPAPVWPEPAKLRALQSEWSEFVVKKARVRELCDKETWLWGDILEARQLIRKTEEKVAAAIADAETLDRPGVDWAEDRVERFVVVLTQADQDRASERNDRGWGAGHSSTGHWCYAMLKRDRALALKVARTIVGGYVRQVEGTR